MKYGDITLRRPLAFIDLETTGMNICRDRIVEISIVKLMPDGEIITKTRRVNPTIPIPPDITEIHHITNEDVADMPTFKQIAQSINDFLKGCDMGGFNILRFDLPLLIEEFQRCKMEFEVDARKIVDSQKIFFTMEPRNLSAAYKFYTGGKMSDIGQAHSAETDALATYRVFVEQVKRYKGREIENSKGEMYVPVRDSVDHIHQAMSGDMVDMAGHLSNRNGQIYFNNGRYKNQLVVDVFKKDPAYYDWLMSQEFPYDTKRRFTRIRMEKLMSK
jgi:DNA polymerase-3 subunit epsilon